MNHRELRRTFLEFFSERGHKIVPSSSLIPTNDPSLLFTGAGMVQFKPFFAGTVELLYRRACSIQKCLRASDLEQVGKTSRHGTFFEMLGNFSFGDYFKADAIPWAWEYLTQVVKLDKDRLYVSVYEEDDEAYEIWHKKVGLPENRIYRLGKEDNFWGPVGGGGACGPCSEIYFDLGRSYGCGKATCAPGCDCGRWSEIYNIVFPQFNQLADGTREPLKNRGIDTGMGMERLAQVSQGKRTIFDTDLFAPIVRETSRILGIEPDEHNRPMFWVAADHARALTFAIADGAIPSNEARGYVLRGILRRALLFAHRQGVRDPFLYRVSGAAVELMRQWYPGLADKREQAALIIKSEEERFLHTLDAGLERWEDVLKKYRSEGVIPGGELFRLHDTFGFHIELVKELAKDENVNLDTEGFKQAMQAQRERSKKAVSIAGGVQAELTVEFSSSPKFVGYEKDETETELVRFVPIKDKEVKGRVYEVCLKDTPFYTEAGGQIGDTGRITGDDFELEVIDSYYKQGLRVCKAKLAKGKIAKGEVVAQIDKERRREIERAHTATHLLHAALRRVVGDYVKQEGSLVEPGRLRFDFAAFKPLTSEQLYQVEKLVYEHVIADQRIKRIENVPLEKAKAMGAMAFFGEQYGEKVTVVKIGDFSKELCAGTHLRSTGEIGMFRIVSETGVAAGIRRIEALVGSAAYNKVTEERQTIERLQESLGVNDKVLVNKVTGLIEELNEVSSRMQKLTGRVAASAAAELAGKALKIGGVDTITGYFPDFDINGLRLVADRVRELLKAHYIGMLSGNVGSGRLRYIVFVSPDLQKQLPAGRVAKTIGQALGGGGGGKTFLAEGGGRADRLSSGQDAFLNEVRKFIT
ncbi:alanine--tRNA ligase [candidate division WOR-3 bacterium JGI_Cruoil_03_51_56]|uniref:Alanine--tRNA ligase n=1 Tax=candidate division WOR-3 bacterium JGI_Cruoil_03_51_56 TaxID=1973747 RepID=A0A235BT49_UNCW3|nr:MAG: alanine--tRNA ligase [candidate division WOR-3 bacterium JGI_Cruoil_03_51_56]